MSIIRISGTAEDWTDWDKLIANIDTCEELTETEKERAKCSLLFLKEEFGGDFLKDSLAGLRRENIQPEKVHPIVSYFMNSAPWTYKWAIRFSEALKSLKDSDGYSCLLMRLMKREQFFEAESVMWAASKFRRSGFNISIDPAGEPGGKIPDLKIIDELTKEQIFVEVSSQMQSIHTMKAYSTYYALFDALTWSVFDNLSFSGRLLKTLSERHLSEVLEKVKNKIEKAKEEQAFQELIIEGTIELAIAPLKDFNVLEAWAKLRGMEARQFYGPPVNEDEVRRTKATVQREQWQLPQPSLGIIVIDNGNLFGNSQGVREVINELEECLYEFPNLLFLIIMDRHKEDTRGEQDEVFLKDQHFFAQRVLDEYNVERTIVMLNRFCDLNASESIIRKVHRAFH